MLATAEQFFSIFSPLRFGRRAPHGKLGGFLLRDLLLALHHHLLVFLQILLPHLHVLLGLRVERPLLRPRRRRASASLALAAIATNTMRHTNFFHMAGISFKRVTGGAPTTPILRRMEAKRSED